MLGTEIHTKFGWGSCIQDRGNGSLVVALEHFHGWMGVSGPKLYTHKDDDIILSHCLCPVGSVVQTSQGVGILTHFERISGLYAVRAWETGYTGEDGPLKVSEEDIIKVFSSDEELCEAVDGKQMAGLSHLANGGIVTLLEARALPTVEVVLDNIPADVFLQQSALELITSVMVGINGFQESASGDGYTLDLGEDGVFDSTNVLPVSRVKNFIVEIGTLLEEGEAKVLEYVHEESLSPEKVKLLYDHWQSASTTIQEVVSDFQKLFLPDAGEDGNNDATSSGLGSPDDDTGLSSKTIYEFLVRLRSHVGKIRELFDLTDDLVEGLELVSSIIADFRTRILEPFEDLPLYLSKKLTTLIPEGMSADVLNQQVNALLEKDTKRLGQRLGAIVTKLIPASSVFDSTPEMATFGDIESFLNGAVDFFDNSKIPDLALQYTGLQGSQVQGRISPIEDLISLAQDPLKRASSLVSGIETEHVSLESLKETADAAAQQLKQQAQELNLSEFKNMILLLLMSIIRANPELSGYCLRKELLDRPHVGLILMICHLYTAEDLCDVELVKVLKDSLPTWLRVFLSQYESAGEIVTSKSESPQLKNASSDSAGTTATSSVSAKLTLADILEIIDSLDGITSEFLANADLFIKDFEETQAGDTYQLAMAHLSTLDLNLMENTKELLSSAQLGTAPGDFFGAAEMALADENARGKLVESVKDNILDFLVSYIPTINISSLDGRHENVEYSISGLDLSGFHFDKDGVSVSISDDIASGEDMLSFSAKNITANFDSVQWQYKQLSLPYLGGAGSANTQVEDASIQLGFRIVRVPKGVCAAIAGETGCFNEASMNVLPKYPALAKQVKLLLKATESQEKLANFPKSYLDAAGVARGAQENPWAKEKPNDADEEIESDGWEPVLLISHHSISIAKLALSVKGDSYAWLYNMLASIFSNILKDRICSALTSLIGSSSSVLLNTINELFASKWDLIQRVMPFDLNSVSVCSAHQFLSLMGPKPEDEEDKQRASVLPQREWSLKFQEEGPLGLKLDLIRENSKEMKVARTAVAGVLLGSQAERVCQQMGWSRSFLTDATVVTVNGSRLYNAPKERIYGLLSGRRPLFLSVRLADQAYSYLRQHTELMAKEKEEEAKKFLKVTFREGPMGMVLSEARGHKFVVVRSFARGPNDAMLQAEASRKCKVGHIVAGVNGKMLLGKSLEEVYEVFKRTTRPATVLFARDVTAAKEITPIRMKQLFM